MVTNKFIIIKNTLHTPEPCSVLFLDGFDLLYSVLVSSMRAADFNSYPTDSSSDNSSFA